MPRFSPIRPFFFTLYITGLILVLVSCGYLQVNPPPDVKADQDSGDRSAWLAAAANMLAAAGYGRGGELQLKAENIYQELIAQFGRDNNGWTDAALQWWLASANNRWPDNPYKMVTVIGFKYPAIPWDDPEGPLKIANLLRSGNFVSVSIGWENPDNPGILSGGHVLNCWGDNQGEKKNTNLFPAHLRVTDSYRNKGGIIQTYKYDDFIKPNPEGNIIRQGWHLSYSENQPFIKHIILLSKVSSTITDSQALRSRFALNLKNEMVRRAAGLHIEFIQDQPSTFYQSQVILENGKSIPGEDNIAATDDGIMQSDWNFDRKDLQSGEELSIIVESAGAMETWTGMKKAYLAEGKGNETMKLPEFSIQLSGIPPGPRHQATNATGGYMVFSLSIIARDTLENIDTKPFDLLILKQYPPDINPEQPVLSFSAPAGYILRNLKAGHSYGYITMSKQSDFSSWMVNQEVNHEFSGDTLSLPVNLIGLLPYPKEEDYFRE